jgi:hypothetical protein
MRYHVEHRRFTLKGDTSVELPGGAILVRTEVSNEPGWPYSEALCWFLVPDPCVTCGGTTAVDVDGSAIAPCPGCCGG